MLEQNKESVEIKQHVANNGMVLYDGMSEFLTRKVSKKVPVEGQIGGAKKGTSEHDNIRTDLVVVGHNLWVPHLAGSFYYLFLHFRSL